MPLVPQVLDIVIGETRNFAFDFASLLGSSVISSVTSVVCSCSDVVITNESNNNTKVFFTISGGNICTRCNVTATVVTNANETLVSVGQLRVSET